MNLIAYIFLGTLAFLVLCLLVDALLFAWGWRQMWMKGGDEVDNGK